MNILTCKPINSEFLRRRMDPGSGLGLTPQQIADKFYRASHNKTISLRSIRKWRNEPGTMVSEENLRILSNVLECEMSDLILMETIPKYRDIIDSLCRASTALEFFSWGNFRIAIQHAQAMMRSSAHSEPSIALRTQTIYAFLQLMSGNLTEAEDRTRKIVSQRRDLEVSRWGLCIVGLIQIYRGRFVHAEESFKKALYNDRDVSRCSPPETDKRSDTPITIVARIGLGTALMYKGDLNLSCSHLSYALQEVGLDRSKDKLIMFVMGSFNYACTLVELGHLDSARARIEKAAGIAEEIPYRRGAMMLTLVKAWIAAIEGNHEAASASAGAVIRAYPDHDPGFIHFEIAARIYRLAEDENQLDDIMYLAHEKSKNENCLSGIFREMGLFNLKRGKIEVARTYFTKAVEGYSLSGAKIRSNTTSYTLNNLTSAVETV